MSEAGCALCNETGRHTRQLPRLDDSPVRFALVPVCELCVMKAVSDLRELADRGASGEDDDAEMDMLLLVAFLKRHGLEITAAHTAGVEGLAGVKTGLHAVLDTLERRLMCSGCGEVIPESRTVVMPWYNDSAGAYVQTFRCRACAPKAFSETSNRLRTVDTRKELDSFGALLQQHGVFVHEWMRGDPDDVVRSLFLRMVDMMASGALPLRLGTTKSLPG